MYTPVNKSKENSSPVNRQESRAVANSVGQKKSEGKLGGGFMDNRPETIIRRNLVQTNSVSNITVAERGKPKENKNSSLIDINVQRKALIPANGKSNGVIQKYSYNADGAEITAKLPKGVTQKWIESIGAKVSWNMGDTMDPNSIGSSKVINHGWVGLLKNQSNNHNATGLHMVNANWGGSANALDGNLVPGTPSLNGHHKSIENKVHSLFVNNSGKAPDNMSYEAEVWTHYDQTMDLTKYNSGDEIPYKDAIIKCTVIVGPKKIVNNEQVELGGGTKIVIP